MCGSTGLRPGIVRSPVILSPCGCFHLLSGDSGITTQAEEGRKAMRSPRTRMFHRVRRKLFAIDGTLQAAGEVVCVVDAKHERLHIGSIVPAHPSGKVREGETIAHFLSINPAMPKIC